VEAEARDAAARLGAELDELKAQRERQEVLPGFFLSRLMQLQPAL